MNLWVVRLNCLFFTFNWFDFFTLKFRTDLLKWILFKKTDYESFEQDFITNVLVFFRNQCNKERNIVAVNQINHHAVPIIIIFI